MPNLIEYLIVGRTPLGSALRAGLIGVLATWLGTLFFFGSSGPLVVGVIIVLIVLPLAYALSKRDNPLEPPPPGTLPPGPGPTDEPVPPASSVPRTGPEDRADR